MEKIRLQKYLSQAWICSRRKAEEYIREWYIKINWKIAMIWESVDPEIDKVDIVDKVVKLQEKFVYYKLNKPRDIVTTMASHWEKSIVDIVDTPQRVFPIWRLDKETTWLILLTNDGRLANYLMHPKYKHEKEYIVKVFGPISDEDLDIMSKWVFILWKKTKPCKIKRLSSWTFSITLTQWMNRQIRRMVTYVWGQVKTLKRVRVENIFLDDMREWELKHLTKKEKENLFKKLWISNELKN